MSRVVGIEELALRRKWWKEAGMDQINPFTVLLAKADELSDRVSELEARVEEL